jgi:Uma2 family endonuclease
MAATSRLTLAQFVAREDTEPASEYAFGEMVQKPMPNRMHAAIQFFLAAILFQFQKDTHTGRGYTELRCIFGPQGQQRAYVPDVCFVAHDRVPTELFLRSAPDLALEILSPDQDTGRFLAKVQFFLQHGVRLMWVIDPDQKTVTVLAPGADAVVMTPGETLDGGDVLPGFALSVQEIFAQAE